MRNIIARSLAAFAALAASACTTAPRSEGDRLEARGQEIAETHCGVCHAVGATGQSAAPEAPPFRELSRSYRVATLEEALAEGISVGHPAMPQFQFPPDDVDALIAYLESIQERRPPS
jgi:mono/diheme cytochrome c family protein